MACCTWCMCGQAVITPLHVIPRGCGVSSPVPGLALSSETASAAIDDSAITTTTLTERVQWGGTTITSNDHDIYRHFASAWHQQCPARGWLGQHTAHEGRQGGARLISHACDDQQHACRDKKGREGDPGHTLSKQAPMAMGARAERVNQVAPTHRACIKP